MKASKSISKRYQGWGDQKLPDIISLHAPLTKETKHVINDRSLGAANGVTLLNASRGALVELYSALAALDEGRPPDSGCTCSKNNHYLLHHRSVPDRTFS